MNGPDIWVAGEIEECVEAARTGLAGAVVTNPTVMARWCSDGSSMNDVVSSVASRIDVPLFVQLRGPDRASLLNEASELLSLSPRVRLKMPATVEGLAASTTLAAKGHELLVTAMGSASSIGAAASAGAKWVCPYVARTRDAGVDPFDMIRNAASLLLRTGSSTRIVPASVRTAEDAQAVLAAGAHGVIVFYAVWKQLLEDPICSRAMLDFEKDWSHIRRI
jgi:TalC/MipB family fructose-6-phosphate aldolase